MKQIRGAIRALAVLLTLGLLSLAVFLGYTVTTQKSRWVTTQYNTRLNSARQSVTMGTVTDRAGRVLAETDAEGVRRYSEDRATRRALSQTVGDQMSMSGTGVETFHAGTLLGLSGSIIDRTWQYLSGGNYRGDDIRLTVDAELSAYISQVFPEGKAGAVCVINYKTGEILSMVSKPDYDPAALVNRQGGADESDSGYLNRCLQGRYAPGSVFKIVTLAAAVENIPGVQDRVFDCEGPTPFGNGLVSCYGGAVHGELTLPQAFMKSCNVAFATLSSELGAEKLVATAARLGFNDNFSFRDLVLYESTIPEKIEDESEMAWTGVGQGKLLVTPMHMAMIAGAVANGGVMREPKLIAAVTGAGGIPKLRAGTGVYAQALDASVAALLDRYMEATVKQGTAKKAQIKGYAVCGKTGTAETSDDKTVPNNAWFVGYIKDAAAPYAVAVVVECGGSGGDSAAPLAAKALKKAISLASGA